MIYVLIADAFLDKVDTDLLEQAAQAALQHQTGSPDGDLSVVIEDDARLQELNKTFLEINAPTDVLSFPSGEEAPDPETGRLYMGDVIVSYPRAVEQSAAAGHSVEDEIRLLVVHGVLHLLGHDHAEAEEKAVMWGAQREILIGLGAKIARLPD